MHFIIETDDNNSLERGMRSLTVTIAKGIKKGHVQLERYHLHVLRTIRETKNAISYVLFNEQKHSGRMSFVLNCFSSVELRVAKTLAKKARLTLHLNRNINEKTSTNPGRSFFAREALKQL